MSAAAARSEDPELCLHDVRFIAGLMTGLMTGRPLLTFSSSFAREEALLEKKNGRRGDDGAERSLFEEGTKQRTRI